MKTRSLLAAVLAACLTAPLGHAALAKVRTTVAPSAALHAGATYAWSPASGGTVQAGVDPTIANPIVETRLRQAIESALAARGYRKATTGQADLTLSYFVALHQRIEGRVTDLGGPGACGVRGCVRARGVLDIQAIQYTEGALVVDLVERSTGKLVWRAATDKRLSPKDVSQKSLDKALHGMTKTLPAA